MAGEGYETGIDWSTVEQSPAAARTTLNVTQFSYQKVILPIVFGSCMNSKVERQRNAGCLMFVLHIFFPRSSLEKRHALMEHRPAEDLLEILL
jgi:hypothetical protein